ncbi:MAG: hypothetical protein M3424_07065 [Actinomycetota bacterium]|nr:hypothetical protein [Actinomycetota bacterium]
METDQCFGRLTWPGAGGMGVASAVLRLVGTGAVPAPRYAVQLAHAHPHPGRPAAAPGQRPSAGAERTGVGRRARGDFHQLCRRRLHDRAAAVEMSGRQTGVQLSVDPLAAHRLLGSPAAALLREWIVDNQDEWHQVRAEVAHA